MLKKFNLPKKYKRTELYKTEYGQTVFRCLKCRLMLDCSLDENGELKKNYDYCLDRECPNAVNGKSIRMIILRNTKRLRNYLRDKGVIKVYYFGACHCGNEGMYFNIYKNHWFHCDNCKTLWWGGWNLFSGWQDENEELWKKNYEEYKNYEEIESITDSLERLWVNTVRFIRQIKLKKQNGK